MVCLVCVCAPRYVVGLRGEREGPTPRLTPQPDLPLCIGGDNSTTPSHTPIITNHPTAQRATEIRGPPEVLVPGKVYGQVPPVQVEHFTAPRHLGLLVQPSTGTSGPPPDPLRVVPGPGPSLEEEHDEWRRQRKPAEDGNPRR